jgi:hypothetical protein
MAYMVGIQTNDFYKEFTLYMAYMVGIPAKKRKSLVVQKIGALSRRRAHKQSYSS